MDHFSLLASFYDRLFAFLDPGPLLRLLQLSGNELLLDVGGGTGRVAEALRGKARTIVLDESTGMLKKALGKGIPVCRALAEALPFASESFERLLVVDAFHHFADHRRAAGELVRVLKKGGRLVLEEPDIRRWPVRLIALGEKLLLMRSRFYALSQLIALFEEAGGKIACVEEDGASLRLVVEK